MQMSLREHLSIPYDSDSSLAHPLRTLDLFVPTNLSAPPPLLVFVHGGAWRSGDKSEHTALARKIALTHRVAVAVPNYRLTERDPPKGRRDIWQHPGHAADVLDAIKFLYAWPSKVASPEDVPYDTERLYFVGHSCGAHILATLFLQPLDISSRLPTPPEILRSTRSILFSEGIYCLQLLLETSPSYASFVEPAFGQQDSELNPASLEVFSASQSDLREGGEHIVWWVVHSPQDSLVHVNQAWTMYDSLAVLTDGLGDGLVRYDFDTLTGEHDETLEEPRFLEIIGDFLR